MKHIRSTLWAAVLAFAALPAPGQEAGKHFVVRDLDTGREEAAAAIRNHVEAHEDWIFLAEFPLKGGEVQAMKICYLPIGTDIFAAGMHVAAMMPCGNLAFYEEDGQARLAMLDLNFLTALNPDPNLERAVEIGNPAFEELLAATLE